MRAGTFSLAVVAWWLIPFVQPGGALVSGLAWLRIVAYVAWAGAGIGATWLLLWAAVKEFRAWRWQRQNPNANPFRLRGGGSW